MVFYTYFENHQTMNLFSLSEDTSDLKKKIAKDCKKFLKELTEGKRSSFICNVKVNQRQKGASYLLRTRVKVIKNTGAEGFTIEGKGQMSNKSQSLTEADFCNDCVKTDSVTENNLEDIMKQVLEMAETVYFEAKDSVQKAQKEYNKKDRAKRMASLKEQRCEGRWDEDSEKFKKFDIEEKLQCKMEKLSSKGLPLEVESFYHRELKNELWKTALSEEDYILEDLLDKFNDPYRYTFSVRASTGLIKNYMNWKEDFSLLDSMLKKQDFIRSIKGDVNQTISFMTKEQSQKDLYFLNKGFDGLFARVNQAPAGPTTQRPTPSINYEDVRRQVKDLYN